MKSNLLTALYLVLTLSMSQSINDTEIWTYFLEKYSAGSGRSFLTSTELSTLVHQNQNSTSSKDCSTCNLRSSVPQALISKSLDCQLSLSPDAQIFNLSTFCPRILYLIDNAACWSSFSAEKASRDRDDVIGIRKTSKNEDTSEPSSKPSPGEVWGYGILFVTIISLSSLAGVIVMPFMGKKLYKNVLTVLIGLAVGSLTGSSVFHLIPQAFELTKDNTDHSYLYTSLVICAGIWMFFMVERLLKIIMEHKERRDQQWKLAKQGSIYTSTPETSTISMLVEKEVERNGTGDHHFGDRMNSSFCSTTSTGIIYECQEQAIKASFGHQEKPKCSSGHEKLVKFEQGKDSVIATVAWMIIFGDGLHNFIDGLSLGAAFNESILTGVSISVAVACEELPHELGDFAVLLNAGMSVRQALIYNFLSACTCYLGMAIGIFLGEVEASRYIFGLAGGMFLYISLVDMVPEMNEVAEEGSKVSVLKGLKILVLQNIGMFVGILALFTLAMFQKNIQF